jgi:hypothetical protein
MKYAEKRLLEIGQKDVTYLCLKRHREEFVPDGYKVPPIVIDFDGSSVEEPHTNWGDIELLSLDALRALPTVGPKAKLPGVYFLWNKIDLVYIGQSTNVRTRVFNHAVYPPAKFDRITFMAVKWPWHLSVEALYIAKYAPPLNSTGIRAGAKWSR